MVEGKGADGAEGLEGMDLVENVINDVGEGSVKTTVEGEVDVVSNQGIQAVVTGSVEVTVGTGVEEKRVEEVVKEGVEFTIGKVTEAVVSSQARIEGEGVVGISDEVGQEILGVVQQVADEFGDGNEILEEDVNADETRESAGVLTKGPIDVEDGKAPGEEFDVKATGTEASEVDTVEEGVSPMAQSDELVIDEGKKEGQGLGGEQVEEV